MGGFVISSVAILLNLLTLLIVWGRLGLRSVDLGLMAFLAVLDIGMSVNNLVRVSGLWSGWLVRYGHPSWWCEWDTTLVFSLMQTSLETVAILGLLRYLAFCHGKVFRWPVWMCLILISLLSSMSITVGFTAYRGSYAWSKSGLLCLPYTMPGMSNRRYFIAWFSLLFSRFVISLVVIVFCYFNVAMAYRRLLDSSMLSSLPKNTPDSQLIPEVPLDQMIRHRRLVVTVSLVGVACGYIICLLPDIAIALCFLLNKPGISKHVMAVSHLLFVSSCILNPLFVLISHDPSRRQLAIGLRKLKCNHSHPL
ncbi:hypothetical protein L0F63_001562 [Massospora cicadina]|nr:hypothetical protein L0F63_001562 [Massospora cicadina]